jgi:hypothetical protein
VALWITDDDGSAAQHPLCSFRVVFNVKKVTLDLQIPVEQPVPCILQ